MRIICWITNRHKPQHIANFDDIKGGRGLWQCKRCKDIIMAAPFEFYQSRKTNHPIW